MISEKHNVIFIHIPKVAGQSIETLFLNDLGLKWQERDKLLLRSKKPQEKGPHRLAHLSYKEYVEYNYVTREKFNQYFKFSFVRNPYSRAISFYNYLGYSHFCNFNSFIKKVLVKKVEKNHFFFKSQTHYLANNSNKIELDFIGKFEHLKQDFNKLKNKLEIDATDLPYKNKSKPDPYRGFKALIKAPSLIYDLSFQSLKFTIEDIDEESKSTLKEIYRDDFLNFNYDF